MSKRQPEIKITYPEASEAAMLLTEAMIKRSSGKRIVETTSEEKEYNGQELFAGALACKTDTSVELTLRLNPDAMDYALTTLIAKNLTEQEKQAIRMETSSMEVVDLLSPRAGEAAGASTCTEEVASAERAADGDATQSGKQEKQIEIGKISDNTLRDILSDMTERLEHEDAIEVIEETIKEIDRRAGVIDLDETYKPDPLILKQDIEAIIQGSLQDNIPSLEHHSVVIIADDMARRLNLHTQIECDPNRGYDRNCIEIAIATLICATQEKEWSREDLAAWADRIVKMLNPNDFTHTSEPSYLATKDISMYIAKGEIHLGLKDIDTAKRLSEELHQEAYQERNKDKQVADQANHAKKTRKKKSAKQNDPSWDDVEAEARQMRAPAPKQSAAPLADDGDDDIEPGLLNDIEDGEEGEDNG